MLREYGASESGDRSAVLIVHDTGAILVGSSNKFSAALKPHR